MESKTWIDPIVEETRANRSALFEECQYDLAKLHQMILQSKELESKRVVPFRNKHPGYARSGHACRC